MKLSGAQQRAYAAVRAAEDGKINSGGGVKRTTVEALARMGLVVVTRTLYERAVYHRDGSFSRRTQVAWTAQLNPQLPHAEALEELDEITDKVRGAQPRHLEQMAAYIALNPPQADTADYNPATAYAGYLRRPAAELIALYGMIRHVTGGHPHPDADLLDTGTPTDYWVATLPGTPDQPGDELCRVSGENRTAACMMANSLLDRRGGYDIRRLGEKELGTWRRDFRAGGRVLRLSANGDGREKVTEVTSGVLVAIGATPAEAEREARAELESLNAALSDS